MKPFPKKEKKERKRKHSQRRTGPPAVDAKEPVDFFPLGAVLGFDSAASLIRPVGDSLEVGVHSPRLF